MERPRRLPGSSVWLTRTIIELSGIGICRELERKYLMSDLGMKHFLFNPPLFQLQLYYGFTLQQTLL